MTELRLDVYDIANSSYIDTLSSQVWERGLLDPLEGVGSGGFSADLEATDDWDVLEPNRIVRAYVKDPGEDDWELRSGWIVRDQPGSLVEGSSSSPEGWSKTVRLDGLKAWWGYDRGGAVLYPRDGLSGRMTNPREFSWRDTGADFSDWVEPDSQGRYTSPVLPELAGRPPGWPDPIGEWLGEPEGPTHVRRVLDIPNATGDKTGPVRFWTTATGNWQLYFDGSRVARGGPFQVVPVNRTFLNREHIITIESDDGPVLWAATRGDALLYRTFSTGIFGTGDPFGWFTGPKRGVTRGFIMKTAIDEAQLRGEVPWLTYDFTATHDSNNEEWDQTIIHAFRMEELGRLDDDILGLMPGDTHMTPLGVMQLFDRLGIDRTATITVEWPFGATKSGEGPRMTRALYETEGGFGEGIAGAADAQFGPMARVLQFGTAIAPENLVQAVQSTLARESQPHDEWVIDLPDGLIPYRHCGKGDTVRVRGPKPEELSTVRLSSFLLADNDQTGQPEWQVRAVLEDA